MKFEKIQRYSALQLAPFFYMRPNKTCDSGMIDTYLWGQVYNVRLCVAEGKALLMHMENKGEDFSSMPWCKEEDLPHYFNILEQYFNEKLKKPLKIYFADEEAVKYLRLENNPDYFVKEENDFKDYLYDAQKLKTLEGKAFQKKRNHIHKFEKIYAGRWKYKSLTCDDKQEVIEFLDDWFFKRKKEKNVGLESFNSEEKGIKFIIENCKDLPFRSGCIYVDGKIKAFSIGSYNPYERMAIISVEKADTEIDGIYQMINREFLINEFPKAQLVNREEDLGLEGLRRAKQSYNPSGYAKKYMVAQKNYRS